MNQQLSQLSNVIDYLRSEVNKDMPIQHLALILAVIEQPGCSMQSLITKLNMSQACVSRNIKILADQYGLLYMKSLESNLRQYAVYPSEKCVELIEKICGLIPKHSKVDDIQEHPQQIRASHK